MLNSYNATQITDYINSHSECKLSNTEVVYLQGNRVDLHIYRLPLNLVFYNIKNGRFAIEYKMLSKQNKKDLDPKNPKDTLILQKLLLSDISQTKLLTNDIKSYGQKEPGIISFDGVIINGNRRAAILNSLEGESLNYFVTARLPENISDSDLWRVEAGIQLSRKQQLEYGPINILLKFQEGLDAGISPGDMAISLYGGYTDKEIVRYLERFKLIKLYLEFIQNTDNFMKVEMIHEHFVDLQKIIENCKRLGYSKLEINDMTLIAFEYLQKTKITHLNTRKIKEIFANSKTKTKFLMLKKTLGKNSEEDLNNTFDNCVEIISAHKNKTKPKKLLNHALSNLQEIDETNDIIKTEEAQNILKEIIKICSKLEKNN